MLYGKNLIRIATDQDIVRVKNYLTSGKRSENFICSEEKLTV